MSGLSSLLLCSFWKQLVFWCLTITHVQKKQKKSMPQLAMFLKFWRTLTKTADLNVPGRDWNADTFSPRVRIHINEFGNSALKLLTWSSYPRAPSDCNNLINTSRSTRERAIILQKGLTHCSAIRVPHICNTFLSSDIGLHRITHRWKNQYLGITNVLSWTSDLNKTILKLLRAQELAHAARNVRNIEFILEWENMKNIHMHIDWRFL